MKAIAVDTSGALLIGSVFEDDKIIAGIQIKGFKHSQNLVSTVQELLSRVKTDIIDIDIICIGIGPGSFTGLRVGISTVKGLSLVKNFNIIPLCSLSPVAYNALYFQGNIWVAVDAKKQSVYVRKFYSGGKGKIKTMTLPKLLRADHFLKILNKSELIIGDAISVYGKIFQDIAMICKNENLWYPSITGLSIYAMEMVKRGRFISSDKILPRYLFAKNVQVRPQSIRAPEYQCTSALS